MKRLASSVLGMSTDVCVILSSYFSFMESYFQHDLGYMLVVVDQSHAGRGVLCAAT